MNLVTVFNHSFSHSANKYRVPIILGAEYLTMNKTGKSLPSRNLHSNGDVDNKQGNGQIDK